METNTKTSFGLLVSLSVILVYVCPVNTLGSLNLDWTAVIGELRHVSVGAAGVWGVHFDGRVFYRDQSRDHDGSKGEGEWVVIVDPEDLPHGRLFDRVDVGNNVVWGVDANGTVFVRMGIDCQNPTGCRWVEVPQKMVHVSVSAKDHVWATDSIGCIWRRVGASEPNRVGDYWEKVEGSLAQISIGGAGVWGVNGLGEVFYRVGTYYDPGTLGTGWVRIAGRFLKDISVGDDKVWGIERETEDVYYRTGLSYATVPGCDWKKVPGKPMKTLDVWAGCVWSLGNFSKPNVFGRLTSIQM